MTLIRKEKHEGSKKRLELQNLWKETSTEELIWLLMKSEHKSVQKRAWEKLKANGELMLSNMYDLVHGPEFIQKELLKMFLEEAGPEDLLEAMDSVSSFFHDADRELFNLLGAKKLRIRKGTARSILLKIIERIPPSRKKAFLLFQKLNPSQIDLQRILDMKVIERDPVMQATVEKLIRKVAKKNHGDKTVQRIEKLEEQLLKKEQN